MGPVVLGNLVVRGKKLNRILFMIQDKDKVNFFFNAREYMITVNIFLRN